MEIISAGSAITINAEISIKEILTEAAFGLEVLDPGGKRTIYKNSDISFSNFVSPSQDENENWVNGGLTISTLSFDDEGIYIIKLFRENSSVEVEDLYTLYLQSVITKTVIDFTI